MGCLRPARFIAVTFLSKPVPVGVLLYSELPIQGASNLILGQKLQPIKPPNVFCALPPQPPSRGGCAQPGAGRSSSGLLAPRRVLQAAGSAHRSPRGALFEAGARGRTRRRGATRRAGPGGGGIRAAVLRPPVSHGGGAGRRPGRSRQKAVWGRGAERSPLRSGRGKTRIEKGGRKGGKNKIKAALKTRGESAEASRVSPDLQEKVQRPPSLSRLRCCQPPRCPGPCFSSEPQVRRGEQWGGRAVVAAVW